MSPSTSTARLLLEPLAADHQDQVFAIYADPATWTHLPTGRHDSPAVTEQMITRGRQSWDRFGLGPWAVRTRTDAGPGPVIGTAGCSMLDCAAWNLGYRFAPSSWGHGYATEASIAAFEAAVRTRPATPVTARVLSGNPASVRVLERIGLDEVWRGSSTESRNADPHDTRQLRRVIFADRRLEPTLLAAVIDLG